MSIDETALGPSGDGAAPAVVWRVTVVSSVANRRYRILDVELAAAGIVLMSTTLTSCASTSVDFASVAAGFGVPGESASTGEELERAPARAAAKHGPDLIEAVLVD